MPTYEFCGAEPREWDGYVSSGGTESNLQALWCYRNELRARYKLNDDEILVVCSEGTHYSVAKACNILNLDQLVLNVVDDTRSIYLARAAMQLRKKVASGVRALIIVFNMGTTMFGSVDDPDGLLDLTATFELPTRVHVDAAFGGFIYPRQDHLR